MAIFSPHRLPMEWQAVLCIGFFLLLLASLPQPKIASRPAEQGWISFTVHGAAQKTGSFFIKQGTLVHEGLQKTRPRPSANLTAFDLKRPILPGEVFSLPSTRILHVLLLDEKQPLFLPLLYGTTCEDLLMLPIFSKGANTEKLQKKRRLRDNEVFRIHKR